MSEYVYNAYPVACAPQAPGNDACATLLRLATVGAMVGGSAAAAHNLQRVRARQISGQEGFIATGRAAAASGLATTMAGAVAGAVADQGGLVRFGLMFATGAAVMYGINRWLEGPAHE